MSRRHAVKALLATAAASAVTVGGFGALSQPSAAGAQASPSDCVTLLILPICSSSSAPTGTPTNSPTASSSAPSSPTGSGSSSAPSGAGSSSAPAGAGSSSATASTAPAGDASAASKPKSVVNVTLSRLRIVQHGKNVVVRFTVTNTGTVAIGGYLITAHVSGYRTRAWLSNIPVGQPIQVTAVWRIVHHHKLVRVLVKGDPRHQVKESDESDNTLSGSKRLR